MQRAGMLSIWFFIGLLLLAYGLLIFATGLAEWSSPPPVVRADLHAAVWWGLLLIAMGLFYSLRFSPRGKRGKQGKR